MSTPPCVILWALLVVVVPPQHTAADGTACIEVVYASWSQPQSITQAPTPLFSTYPMAHSRSGLGNTLSTHPCSLLPSCHSHSARLPQHAADDAAFFNPLFNPCQATQLDNPHTKHKHKSAPT